MKSLGMDSWIAQLNPVQQTKATPLSYFSIGNNHASKALLSGHKLSCLPFLASLAKVDNACALFEKGQLKPSLAHLESSNPNAAAYHIIPLPALVAVVPYSD